MFNTVAHVLSENIQIKRMRVVILGLKVTAA